MFNAHLPQASAARLSPRESEVHREEKLRLYQAERQRWALRHARMKRDKARGDVDEFIQFALIWVPFGGAPTAEIFQRFGMSRERFGEILW
ncbi:hypothetical protein, partial [Rhodococcus sp. NPDC057529]|uniref:hypothetical protein n=1 Tax=Rhodococcus sp. NPDC057529 TaxID=3346158 RepID=UPI00366AD7A6